MAVGTHLSDQFPESTRGADDNVYASFNNPPLFLNAHTAHDGSYAHPGWPKPCQPGASVAIAGATSRVFTVRLCWCSRQAWVQYRVEMIRYLKSEFTSRGENKRFDRTPRDRFGRLIIGQYMLYYWKTIGQGFTRSLQVSKLAERKHPKQTHTVSATPITSFPASANGKARL